MDFLSLHNSNSELSTNLHSPPTHGIKDIPIYFEHHCELFITHIKSSDHLSYIQAYKHTIELLLNSLDSDILLNEKIIEFLSICHPSHLFSLCIHTLKRPDKSVLTYQNSLSLLIYTLQPVILAKVVTSNLNFCDKNPLPNEITILNPLQTLFIQNLCAIPDLVLNKLSETLLMTESNKDYTQSPVYPKIFYSLIVQVILHLLLNSSDNHGRSAQFFASLMHQICLLGFADILARDLIKTVKRKEFTSSSKVEILKVIVSKILPRGLEKLLESLFSQYYTHKFGDVSFFSKILPDPLSYPRIKTVLIDRLIMSRQFPDTQNLLLHNLLHYICNEVTELVVEILETILSAFKSQLYVDGISLEQHRYLCRVIILCIRYYTIHLHPIEGSDILQAIKEGYPQCKEDKLGQFPKVEFPKNFQCLLLLTQNMIEVHLTNSRSGIKLLGQVIGEVLCSWLNNDPSNTLNFELPTDDQTVIDLRSLLTSPHEKPPLRECVPVIVDKPNSETVNPSIIPELQKMFESEKANEIILSHAESKSSEEIETLILPNSIEPERTRPLIEILSDSENSDCEDLQPFPSTLSDPAKKVGIFNFGIQPVAGPYSLRECVEWMGTGTKPNSDIENAKRIEAALNKVESFIRASPHDLKVWSRSLSEILLHLTNPYSIQDLPLLRMNSLIALCVHDPIITATYLTEEFYAVNNCLQSRYDILMCFERAGAELASIGESKTIHSHFQLPLTKYQQAKTQPKIWEDIIKERLKLKTRIISSPRKQSKITENTFGDIVGYFFYPLLYNFDKSIRTMHFFGDDVWLFCALLKTIGNLVIYSQGTIALRKMASTLFDFLLAIKTVGNTIVKQGVCFCILCVLEVTPGYYILPDLSSQVEELIEYLQNILTNDADKDSLVMTSQTLHQISLLYRQYY